MGFIADIFNPPKPKPQPTPTPPSPRAEQRTAIEGGEQRNRRKLRKRTQTILTGVGGAESEGRGRKTLLGG